MDLINREDAIKAIKSLSNANPSYWHQVDVVDRGSVVDLLEDLPAVEPCLFGYKIEHLVMIARVMEKENVPPEKVIEILTDVGRITEMVLNEQELMLKKTMEKMMDEMLLEQLGIKGGEEDGRLNQQTGGD